MSTPANSLTFQPFNINAARQAGYSDDEIIQHLSQVRNFDYNKAIKAGYTKDEILNHLVQPSASPGGTFTTENVLNFLRPMVAGGVGALGATAGSALGPFGGVAGGIGGYAFANRQLKNFISGLTGKPEQPSIFGQTGIPADIEEGVENEALGRVPALIKGFATSKGVTNTIAKLQPTFSQYYRSVFGSGFLSQSSKWLEDIFATGSKMKAQEASAALGMDLAHGRPFNPNEVYNDVQAALTSGLRQSYTESSRLAGKVLATAELNPHIIMSPVEGVPGAMVPKTIPGPIDITSSVAAAHKYLDDQARNIVPGVAMTERQQELTKLANNIIGMAEVTDPVTKQVTTNPVSFRTAWDLKQMADEFGHPPKVKAKGPADITVPSELRDRFQSLAETLNNDIDHSIPKWQNTGTALQDWQDAKATVGQRQVIFNTRDDVLSKIIDSAQTNLPDIDKIVADPRQLRRAINAGEVTFPSGNKITTATRQDFQAYALKNILKNAWDKDAIDIDKGTFNTQKLMGAWTADDFQDSKNILFNSQQRADIDQLFKNLAITQEKRTFMGSYAKLWLARGAITLSPALITGYGTGIEHTAPLVSVGLGAVALSHLMTNPRTARMLVAAAQDAPLGASNEVAGRLITRALAGGVISLNYKDGTSIDGTLNKDGKFEPSVH